MIGTIIDIETTGWLKFDMIKEPNPYVPGTFIDKSVLSNESEILEVGYININMETNKILTYGTLYFYKPYFNIENDAQKVHGLTRDFLMKYEDKFMDNIIALNAMLQSTCIIGKNSNKFDVPFIKAFIEKHVGDIMDIPALVQKLSMNSYSGGKVRYFNDTYALDMQSIYRERYHELYRDKTGIKLMPGKKGKLEEYIEVINNGQQAVDYIYNSLDKDRVTGAHGALYDAVMTYVVWLDAKMNNLY